MNRADAAWRAELASTSIAGLVEMVGNSASPLGLRKGLKWLTEALG
jgi:hypothetical protein